MMIEESSNCFKNLIKLNSVWCIYLFVYWFPSRYSVPLHVHYLEWRSPDQINKPWMSCYERLRTVLILFGWIDSIKKGNWKKIIMKHWNKQKNNRPLVLYCAPMRLDSNYTLLLELLIWLTSMLVRKAQNLRCFLILEAPTLGWRHLIAKAVRC